MTLTEHRKQRTEIRAAARDVRRMVAEALAFLDAGDVNRAFAAAEEAQHLAFDMKDRIARIVTR